MFLTTTSKVNAVKKLIREKKYDEAVEIAEKIDPEKVNSVYDLSSIAEAYMKKGRLEEAKHLYLVMYERNKSHKVMTGLIELSLKLKEPKDAERFLREFRRMEPDNPERLVYRYRVDSMLGKDPEFLVKSLAKLKNEEYTDVWALELAKAYYKCNDREACAAECHSILKYFPDSEVAKKANVLLGACELEDEEPEVETPAVAEEVDTTEIAESLLQDVSAMLEENAAAEAVANEVIDEKTLATQKPAHPVPYLRTLEFLVQSKAAAEDKSLYGELESEKEEPAEETASEMKALSEEFVLPEALKGRIDNVIFETDDDEDDIVIACGAAVATETEEAVTETEETVSEEAASDEDDDDDDDIVIEGYFDDADSAEATEEAESEEEEAEEAEDSEEADDDAEEEESDEDVEEEDVEESDEDDDESDESDEEEESDEESEDEDDAEDESDDEDDADDADEDDTDDDSDGSEEEEDAEDSEDAGVADEYFEDEISDEEESEENVDGYTENDPLVDETLESVSDVLASQILSATAEEKMLRDAAPEESAEEPAEKPEDTKVMEGLSDRAFREAVKDDDEAIERALYSLLGDDSRSKK
ncbi:MAG: hypothetical protein K6E71_09725 [Lachnospiraceae bacterium]|nr:hypothetical protein [Lachnospiraceae bacterium]